MTAILLCAACGAFLAGVVVGAVLVKAYQLGKALSSDETWRF